MFSNTNDVIVQFWMKFINYIPDFFGGLIILFIGLFVSILLKKILLTLFSFFRVDSLLNKTGLITQKEVRLWEEILAELLRWTIIILFLVPTLEAWGLSKATSILNQFLFYIPNIIVAVIIGFVGIITSNLISDVVKNSVKSLGTSSANTLAVFSRSTVLFFIVLVMLNQLGVAQDLIRIFFTGLVVMLALAGGLAFGLGGKDSAKEIIDNLRKKLKQG